MSITQDDVLQRNNNAEEEEVEDREPRGGVRDRGQGPQPALVLLGRNNHNNNYNNTNNIHIKHNNANNDNNNKVRHPRQGVRPESNSRDGGVCLS